MPSKTPSTFRSLGEAIHALAAAILSIARLGTKLGQDAAKWVVSNLTEGALKIATTVLGETETLLAPIVQAFVTAIQRNGPGLANEITGPAEAFAANVLLDKMKAIHALDASTPENSLRVASELLANAFGFGLASAGVTAAFESVFPEKLNMFNAMGPILAEMAGFEEVTAEILKPAYKAAFGRSAEYLFKQKFKPDLPDEADAVLWHARGLLLDPALRKIFDFSGLKPEYEEAFVESAYRGMSPFIMIRMMETGIFTKEETTSELTFTGLRPLSQARAIRAAHEMALIPYKQKVVTAVTAAFARGDISEVEFDDTLNNLTLPPGAVSLLAQDAHFTKLEQLLQLYRRQVTQLYETGQLLDADYVPTLEAAGINEADAEAHFGLDSARLRGKQLAAAERAAARAAETLQREAVRAAEESYLSGQIDEAALETALELAGVPVAVVALLVQIMRSRRIGALVEIFGLRLNRHDAILLREKVDALKEQVIKKLFGLDAARQTLQSFGIPAANLEALLAEWAAHLKTLLQV